MTRRRAALLRLPHASLVDTVKYRQLARGSESRRHDAPLIAWSAVHGMSSVLVRGMLPPPYAPEEAIHATIAGVRDALQVRHPPEFVGIR